MCREFHEPGCWYFSAQFLRGFVVSANLRNTCWSYDRGEMTVSANLRDSAQTFHNYCADKCENYDPRNSLVMRGCQVVGAKEGSKEKGKEREGGTSRGREGRRIEQQIDTFEATQQITPRTTNISAQNITTILHFE